MGLEDFTSDTTEESSSITTRKKLKNVNLEREYYELVITTDPYMMETAASYTDESSIKAIVQCMDEIIDEGLDGHNISDEKYDEIQAARDNIVEDHL